MCEVREGREGGHRPLSGRGAVGIGREGTAFHLPLVKGGRRGGEGGAPFIDDTEGEGEGDSIRSLSLSKLNSAGEEKLTSARSASTRGLPAEEERRGRRVGETREEPMGVEAEEEDRRASVTSCEMEVKGSRGGWATVPSCAALPPRMRAKGWEKGGDTRMAVGEERTSEPRRT